MSEQWKFGLFVLALFAAGLAAVTLPIADYVLAIAPATAFAAVLAVIIYAFVDAIAGQRRRYRN